MYYRDNGDTTETKMTVDAWTRINKTNILDTHGVHLSLYSLAIVSIPPARATAT